MQGEGSSSNMQGEGSNSNLQVRASNFNTQAQASTSNSLTDIFNFDHEPNDNSLGLDQQNHDFQQWLGEDGWFPSIEAHDGIGQRSQEHLPKTDFASFHEYMSRDNAQVTNGQSMLQGFGSGSHSRNIDLNVTYEGNESETNQEMGAGLSLRPFSPSRPDGEQNPPAADSSNALVISSGVTGYVLEENDSSEGLLPDGRRLSCKRRAPEVAHRPLYRGESSSSAQTNLLSHSEQLDTRLVIGLPAASAMHQTTGMAGIGLGDGNETPNLAGHTENFQRNTRLRSTVNQQDSEPPSFLAWAQRISQPPSQPAVFQPFDRFPSASSAGASSSSGEGIVRALPAMQCRGQVPNSFQTQQPSQNWNRLNREDSWNQEENNQRNVMLPLEFERGNMACIPTNLTLGYANANSPENIASTSSGASSSGAHQPFVPYWFSHPHMVEQHAQRVSGQGNNCPLHSGASATSQEPESSGRGGDTSSSQVPQRPEQMTIAEGQVEGQAGAHPETDAQRRSRLVSEVREAWALVHRDDSLQLEDVMVIGGSVLFGVPEERGYERVRERGIHIGGRERDRDDHEDMRLDVNNMSYEELLALEEQIGNVSTGLSEETIQEHLRSTIVEPPVEDAPCCICQEEYARGEDLGKLDCGHYFHFNCIKQWLAQKNLCPICKMTGLAMRERKD